MRKDKSIKKFISGSRNIRFSDMQLCVEAFGFHLSRINGSHHIYIHPDIPELVNIQDVKGKAKPYQIKQFLRLIEKYDLHMEEEK